MKVLHLSTSDIQGGAFIAAYRLHKGLQKSEVDSSMLVQLKKGDDHSVYAPSIKVQRTLSVSRPLFDSIFLIFYPKRKEIIFSTSMLPENILKKINKLNPDIIHLNWITGGFIRVETLKKINKPIIWTMHDMWPFTGGCHYNGECEKYKKKCGSCYVLGSQRKNDLSKWIFNRKFRTYKNINNLTIVTPSQWLKNRAKESILLKNQTIKVIPNTIDVNTFKPVEKKIARGILNISTKKKIILFGAVNATSDDRKGYDYLISALDNIENKDSIELVVFGASKPKKDINTKFRAHYFGRVYDDITLNLLYSAADVMIVPSKQENLSCSIMESLSCGTPVVAFDIGGNSDMIEHKKNGFLVKPFEPRDMANGIEWIINNENLELSKNARKKVIENFSVPIITKKYIEVYKEAMAKNKHV
ncbi:MAG: glycosyltransferase family 4 protein [Patescibacteria group bacterium]